MNSPRRSVLVWNFRATPPWNSMVMTTPARGLPPSSTTLPLIIVDCADAADASARPRLHTSATRTLFMTMSLSSLALKNTLLREKAPDLVQPERHRRRGERIEEPLAIGHRPQPRIQYRQHASVISVTDQPAQPLQHREDGKRYLVLLKRVAPFGADGLDACRSDRIPGR